MEIVGSLGIRLVLLKLLRRRTHLAQRAFILLSVPAPSDSIDVVDVAVGVVVEAVSRHLFEIDKNASGKEGNVGSAVPDPDHDGSESGIDRQRDLALLPYARLAGPACRGFFLGKGRISHCGRRG